MSYKIVMDSCGELTEEMRASGLFESVPFEIEVGTRHITDDESFDRNEFLKYVREAPECPKSACPPAGRFLQAFCCEAERVYAVTVSEKVSGSYNSALVGKDLYEEEYGKKQIHVFNSCSASVGETLTALKIMECEEKGMSFEETIGTVEAYIRGQHVYAALGSIETFRKTGRLSGIKAILATTLNIKPVIGATTDGKVRMIGQVRGTGRALEKLAAALLEEVSEPEKKVLAIAHCNAPEHAETIRDLVSKGAAFQKIVVVETSGLSSMYVENGGVIAAV